MGKSCIKVLVKMCTSSLNSWIPNVQKGNEWLNHTRSDVKELVEVSQLFHIGQKLGDELAVPFDKTKCHPCALTTKKYEVPNTSGGPKDATP